MREAFITICFVGAILVAAIGPAFANYPSPANLHMAMDEQHNFQIRMQAETVKDILLDNVKFIEEGRLKAFFSFSLSSFDLEAINLAVDNFKKAGWGAYLVGSAEQGFLHIYDQLENSRPYMSITPCFRDDKEDELHQRYFMKLELFMKGGSYSDCDFFKEKAGAFFRSQGVETYTLRTAENSYDLEALGSGIELGSYYHREIPNYKWACGTGLAQPRFDIAKGKQ